MSVCVRVCVCNTLFLLPSRRRWRRCTSGHVQESIQQEEEKESKAERGNNEKTLLAPVNMGGKMGITRRTTTTA